MRLEADLHTHSVASGHAYSTVKEMAEAAGAKGLKAIAVTDHGPTMEAAPPLDYFFNTFIWPQTIGEVRLLRGVEANIIDTDGGLDLPTEILKELDVVLAGFHEVKENENTIERNTKAMAEAMRNPFVDIIVHPGNAKYPVDLEAIVKTAKEFGKALEINNSTFLPGIRPKSKERCFNIALLAKRYKVPLVVDSDAHIFSQVGECSLALELIAEAGIKEEEVINTSLSKLKEFLNSHGKKIDFSF